MKTMLAAYLPGNSTVDLREVAVPTPGINQVLIKMKSSGICGSDVHYIYHQHRATAAAPDKPLYLGFINGHEPPKVCRRLSPNSPTVARMLRSIVLVMPQVACWHCNPPLTGDGWFTLVKPEKWNSRSAPI